MFSPFLVSMCTTTLSRNLQITAGTNYESRKYYGDQFTSIYVNTVKEKERDLTNYLTCKSADWTSDTNVFLCERAII